MTNNEFMSKLAGEMNDFTHRLRNAKWPNDEQFINGAKELARMSDVMDYFNRTPVEKDTTEYLLRSHTPLSDIAYLWKEFQDMSVREYGVEDALQDIVDKDLFRDEGDNLDHIVDALTMDEDTPAPENTIEGLKRNVTQNQESLTVTQTQKLLCDIGEMLEQSGGEQDQYYLFSHRMGGFAGFCGEPVGVNDIGGNPLFIGDMTSLNGQPDKSQLVFRHSSGDPFPSQSYVNEARVVRVAGWQESMMFLRSKDFDVISCRDDYRMSKQIASRMHTQSRDQGRTGR